MRKIGVIGDKDSVLGFKALGLDVFTPEIDADVRKTIERLAKDDYCIIFITEQMAVKAVDLLDDTDEGFFLMIEGAHIDKHSHNYDGNNMTQAMLEFDRTIDAMLKYAEVDGETLVVVTADHETGAITFMNGVYVYTSNSHSASNVLVRVYGYDGFIDKNEVLDNYEIPIRIARVLGFGADKFPASVRVG